MQEIPRPVTNLILITLEMPFFFLLFNRRGHAAIESFTYLNGKLAIQDSQHDRPAPKGYSLVFPYAE